MPVARPVRMRGRHGPFEVIPHLRTEANALGLSSSATSPISKSTLVLKGHVSAFVEHFFDVDVTMSQRSSHSISDFCEYFETGFVKENFGIFSLRRTSKFPFTLPMCSTNAGTRVFN